MFLIIANIISLVAAVFTCLSCWEKDERKIYLYQVGQCLLLSVAAFFFGTYAGIVTLFLCAVRNFLLAIKKYSIGICLFLAAATLILGAVCNNSGMVGWIVIMANVIYTLGAFLAKNELLIKLNIILDLTLWMIYEVFIIDIPSFISDGIAMLIAIAAVIRYLKNKNREHEK